MIRFNNRDVSHNYFYFYISVLPRLYEIPAHQFVCGNCIDCKHAGCMTGKSISNGNINIENTTLAAVRVRSYSDQPYACHPCITVKRSILAGNDASIPNHVCTVCFTTVHPSPVIVDLETPLIGRLRSSVIVKSKIIVM